MIITKIVNSCKRIAKHRLNFVIFFVTSNCNSRCRSCFFWQNLNHNSDLDLEQIRRASANLGQFDTLLLSGGEPFLRADLPELVGIFAKNNGIKSLGIPTNTLLGDRIIETVKRIKQEQPGLNLNINVSLDGPEEIHDYIRGVEGNFEKALYLLSGLRQLKRQGIAVNITVNSVICRKNYDSLLDFALRIKRDFGDAVGSHIFEIIRGDAKDPSEKELSLKQVRDIFNRLYSFQEENYLSGQAGLAGLIARASLIAKYNLQYRAYANRRWPVKCRAGETSAVIYPDGNVAYCELKSAVGRLDGCDYDPLKLLAANLRQIKSRISREKCDCTHVCFVHEAIWNSFFGVFCLLPYYLIKRRLTGKAV